MGYYNATKFAVEGLSESLSKEVAPLGIKVLVVEPGPFRTDWAGRSLKRSSLLIPEYTATAGAFRERIVAAAGSRSAIRCAPAAPSSRPWSRTTRRCILVLGAIALETARTNREK